MLADFKNITGDPVFDDTLKQAISATGSVSISEHTFGRKNFRATLRPHGEATRTQVTPDVARSLSTRGRKSLCRGDD